MSESGGNPGKIPLLRLVQDLGDGEIPEAHRCELMRRLRESPSARVHYLEHMMLVALLQQVAETRGSMGTIPISPEVLRRAARKSAWAALSWGIAAVLACALGLMLFKVGLDSGASAQGISLAHSDEATYRIENASDSSGEAGHLNPGDRITLERGLLQLRFPKGVEALIEGPCDLELTSVEEIRLDGGMAWFRVPNEGRGFAVRTDLAKVIDLGTEFGIWFDGNGGVQAHVAKGRVRIEPNMPGSPPFEVTEGKAISLGADGESAGVNLMASLFRRSFSSSIPYVHWSFDWLVDGSFPSTGTMPGAPSFRAELRRREGQPDKSDERNCLTDGIRGKAFTLAGGGLFAESEFPGISGTAPRTVAAWVRHRAGENRFGGAGHPFDDPYPGYGVTTPFGEQAFLLNYARTGLSTEPGAIGEKVAAGTTYDLSFHVAARPGIPNPKYRVELVAFAPGVDNDALSKTDAGQVLAVAEGEAFAHDLSGKGGVSFTAAPGDPNVGKELGIRIVHVAEIVAVRGRKRHGGRVLYDHIRLTAREVGSGLREIFSEGFEEPRVVGYAGGVIPAEGWIASGSTNCGLFNHRPPSGTPYFAWGKQEPGQGWAGFVHEGKTLSWATSTGESWVASAEPRGIGQNEWVHVASVFTGNFSEDGEPEIAQYVNGKRTGHQPALAQSSGQGSRFDTWPDSTLRFGALPGSGTDDPTLNGDIDELFILRAALGGEEIIHLMETNSPVSPKNFKK